MNSNRMNISVIICTYNGAKFINEQIDSILNQSYPAKELIIQDDCSTDNTLEILRKYATRFPQITVVENKCRQGINKNFFSAISKASGDYIAISDQDDIWEPNKLELQINAIGDKLLCAGRTTPFSDNGAMIRIDSRKPNYSLIRMIYVGCLAGHTLLFSKELLSRLPDISQISAIRCYDAILTMVAASYDSIVYIDQTLVYQRKHVDAATYCQPTNNRFTLANIARNLIDTVSYYRELKPEIRNRAAVTYRFLSQIKSGEPILKHALYMLNAQMRSSFPWQMKLSFFCYKHQDKLFHTSTRKNVINSLRALYFPISCSIYFRYLSKRWEAHKN